MEDNPSLFSLEENLVGPFRRVLVGKLSAEERRRTPPSSSVLSEKHRSSATPKNIEYLSQSITLTVPLFSMLVDMVVVVAISLRRDSVVGDTQCEAPPRCRSDTDRKEDTEVSKDRCPPPYYFQKPFFLMVRRNFVYAYTMTRIL